VESKIIFWELLKLRHAQISVILIRIIQSSNSIVEVRTFKVGMSLRLQEVCQKNVPNFRFLFNEKKI
jgi:hypothetical protein